MNSITEMFILDILDETHDGILPLSVFIKKDNRLTKEVYGIIFSLTDKGILKIRDCEEFALERTGNTMSRYGEQKYFNEYIHLTKAQLTEEIAKSDSVHGLVIHIMNDMGSCINSRNVSSEEEGIRYFNKTYDGKYSYTFTVSE